MHRSWEKWDKLPGNLFHPLQKLSQSSFVLPLPSALSSGDFASAVSENKRDRKNEREREREKKKESGRMTEKEEERARCVCASVCMCLCV